MSLLLLFGGGGSPASDQSGDLVHRGGWIDEASDEDRRRKKREDLEELEALVASVVRKPKTKPPAEIVAAIEEKAEAVGLAPPQAPALATERKEYRAQLRTMLADIDRLNAEIARRQAEDDDEDDLLLLNN